MCFSFNSFIFLAGNIYIVILFLHFGRYDNNVNNTTKSPRKTTLYDKDEIFLHRPMSAPCFSIKYWNHVTIKKTEYNYKILQSVIFGNFEKCKFHNYKMYFKS